VTDGLSLEFSSAATIIELVNLKSPAQHQKKEKKYFTATVFGAG